MAMPQILKFGFPSVLGKNSVTGETTFTLRHKDLQFADLLSSAFNVEYEIVVSTDGEYGSMLPNGTFTGPMGLVQRDEVDVVVPDLAITRGRKKAAEFSYPYFYDGFTFATKKPEFLPKFLAVVYPFTFELWILIVACLIFMCLLFYTIHRQRCSFEKAVLKTFGIFLNKCTGFDSGTLGERLLLVSWMLGSMFITMSYMAVLLSFLTLPVREEGIKTIQDLSDAIAEGKYHAATYKGNYIPEVLSRSKDQNLHTIGNDVKNHLIRVSQTKDLLLYWNSKMALIAPRNYIAFLQNRCFISKDDFFSVMIAIAYRKSFCCPDQIDTVAHRIIEFGLHKKLNNEFLFRSFLDELSAEERHEEHPEIMLTLADMSGAFSILLIGYIMSVSVFILEIAVFKIRTRIINA